jgi:peptide/nickel transport system permease protein
MAGWIAAGLSLLIGIIVGTLAGFYGGWIDQILMRGGELFLALPWLYLLFAVRAALPLHIAEWQVFLLLIAVMGLIGWARPARLIRGVVLSAKERNFVLAARGFGASDAYVICRHVLPQTYGVVLTQMTLLIPQYVLAEVTLSFLGHAAGCFAAILRFVLVLVDVLAGSLPDPRISPLLRRRRCSAGTPVVRAAIKT